MRKHAIFTVIAVTAVLFTACENVEIPEPNSGNAVEFRTLVDKNGTTKASLVDKVGDLSSFFVTAWLEDQSKFMESAVWRKNAGWDYAPKKYYPADGAKVNFYAYSPIKDVNMVDNMGQHVDLVNNGGNVSFDYTVPNNQSVSNTAVDLLVASVTNKTAGEVAFEFNHALSGVTFSARNNNPVYSELVFIVTGIEITDLYNKGTFTYKLDFGDWVPISNLVNYKAGIPESGVPLTSNLDSPEDYVNLLSANDIMMVLPQKIVSESQVEVTFSLKDGSGAFVYNGYKRYLPLPNGFIFEPGTLYNFQFQFEAMNAITFKVTKLESWVTQDQPIPVP